MKRDGQALSLWQHGIPAYPTNQKSIPSNADVVIVGGGITGVTTALKLQMAGKNCVLIEAQGLGFGTTGGTTAHLNTIMDTPYYKINESFGENNARLVAQIARNSIEQIERYITEFSIECGFGKKSAYLFSQDGEQSVELEKIIDGSKNVAIEIDYCASLPVAIPFKKVARVNGQAQLHAVKYIYGLASVFEQAGGFIAQNCTVTDVISRGKETVVVTSDGEIAAGYVVYATHIPPGVNILHFRCAPYRSYAMAIKLKDNNYPDALVYDLYDPYHYYRTHEIAGTRYLIAGGEDHKTAHEKDTRQCMVRLESYVRKYFDVESIPFAWSSQYFEPADGLPYIGHLPGNAPNIFVATGFGGNGMIYGTASAEIIADLICNGESEYKELFNPARVKPVAGFENFVKEAADVAGVFVSKRLEVEKIEGVDELEKGEAKVVKLDGDSVAIYKDNSGELFAVNK
jgi:glycine/D-amino acid oxidase-like deaminating enzyme